MAYGFLRFRPSRVEVTGPSMVPTLMPGDWAMAIAAKRPRRGDVVVVQHPDREGFEMVKRLVGTPGDIMAGGRVLGPDEWWVEGDDRDRSTDSRRFGPVSRAAIVARVRLIYWPPERRRLL